MISFFKNSFSFEVYHRIKLINIINTAFSLNTYVWQKRKLKEETYGDSYKGGGGMELNGLNKINQFISNSKKKFGSFNQSGV